MSAIEETSPLVGVDEALERVLANVAVRPRETVAIAEACGRVLAADATALVDLPRFPSSAMDGFAVRADDCPGVLTVIDRVQAGIPSARVLEPGQAIAIATGGVIPSGADTVVPIEEATDRGTEVAIELSPRAGAHIRPVGGDIAADTIVGRAGTVIGPARLAALAATGCASVLCGQRPRVVIVATGSELRPPGSDLEPGQIYESNGAMLGALCTLAGGTVEHVTAIPDDPEAHRVALERALTADVVLTSGGVSVGAHDLVRPTLAALGVGEVLWGVRMRPGKPLYVGRRDDTLVFGLPGNPVSSYVSAVLFVIPALLALQGAHEPGPTYGEAPLAAAAPLRPEREDFVRGRWLPNGAIEPLARQESHMIVAAAEADVLARLPAGTQPLPAGSPVRYLRLDERVSGA